MPDALLTSLLYQAASSPHGIIISTNDPDRAISKLYSARKALNDLGLEFLRMKKMSDGSVWIMKGLPKL